MFRGRYTHTVDSKGRVAIPARFRMQLEEGAVGTQWLDGCAAIFTRDGYEDFAARVGNLPLADERARSFKRWFFSSAFDVENDAQGRIVLPAYIREWAGLGVEALIVGAQDHIEIWDPKKWEKAQSTVASPGDLASQMSGLGI
jgi:MraZ protein